MFKTLRALHLDELGLYCTRIALLIRERIKIR